MKCPYCSYFDTGVLDSRDSEDLQAVRRRRECHQCHKRFTTYERVEMAELIVVKKSGQREKFDKGKLLSGLFKAAEKRPINANLITTVADEMERELRSQDTIEISSHLIGELVMKKLKNIDKVAYIRFASVYRDFQDIDSFEKELKRLKPKVKVQSKLNLN